MLLEIENLHAHYGKSHVLQGVNLSVDEGEIIAILGRNGVGKSTTLKSIMGLVAPSSGRVSYRQRDIQGLRPHQIARLGLGFVPEDRRVFPTITVAENLKIGMKPSARGGTKIWTLDRIYQLFPKLGERVDQLAGTLSGGEQQMLTMGRTLLGHPDLILIDEPMEGLAPVIVDQVERMIHEISSAGTSILLVEQNLDTVLRLTDRLYVMAKGEIVFSGTGRELESNPVIRRRYLEV